MVIKTTNGTIKVVAYDDGDWEGVNVIYTDKDGNESMVSLDISKFDDEARALVYKVDEDDPEVTTLN